MSCHVCRTILKRPGLPNTQRPVASQSFWTIGCSFFHPTVFIPTTITSSCRIPMEKLRRLRTAAIQHRDFLQLLLWDPVWGRGCQRTTGFDLWGLCYKFDLSLHTAPNRFEFGKDWEFELGGYDPEACMQVALHVFWRVQLSTVRLNAWAMRRLGTVLSVYAFTMSFFLASFHACM